VTKNFQKLRTEAEEWHRARTEYMMARLQQGRHPDTDARFWSDWKEQPMPKLNPERLTRASEVRNRWLLAALIAAFALLVGICTAAVYGVLYLHRRFRQRSA
jgi:hypothetical protein